MQQQSQSVITSSGNAKHVRHAGQQTNWNDNNINTPPETLYAVYTFSDDLQDGQIKTKWYLEAVLENKGEAMRTARNFFESNQYKRVEVKKTYYNHSTESCDYTVIKSYKASLSRIIPVLRKHLTHHSILTATTLIGLTAIAAYILLF